MDLYFGANHDLEKLIKTHLFVICATNSGTSLLRKALATSEKTWNLMREGQHLHGFKGPSSFRLKLFRCWAANDELIAMFTNPEDYDWETTRRTWYFQASSYGETAPVFVEKSPPFLLIVDQLAENFKNPRFLFMVRNPYAVIEGIRRKFPAGWKHLTPAESITKVTNHVVNCLKFQKRNIETQGDKGVFFSYEQMCEEPEKVESLIKNLVPEIDDLVLRQRFKIREYHEDLRNMNEDHIARLSRDDIRQINETFTQHQDLLNYFGYPMRD